MRKRELLFLGFSYLESSLHRRLCLDVLLLACRSQYMLFSGTGNKLFCKHPGVPGLVTKNHYTGKLMLILFIYPGRQGQGFGKQHFNFIPHRTKIEKLKNQILFCPDKQLKKSWANPVVKDACLASTTLSVWWTEPESVAWTHGCLLACIPHGSSGQVSQEQALARHPGQPSAPIPVLLLRFCILLSTTPFQYFGVAHRQKPVCSCATQTTGLVLSYPCTTKTYGKDIGTSATMPSTEVQHPVHPLLCGRTKQRVEATFRNITLDSHFQPLQKKSTSRIG